MTADLVGPGGPARVSRVQRDRSSRRRRRLLDRVGGADADADSSRERMTRAGTPPTRVLGGTSETTTAPAATTAPAPIETPPTTVTAAPIHAPSPIVIGSN